MGPGRIPNKLISFRNRKGYSRKKVSRALNHYDTSLLCRWESGERVPNALQLLQLATIYEVLPQDLYDEKWLQYHHDENLLISDEMFTSNQQLYV
jgi:transcriptional regulator with XRE-family HTH domain